MKIRITVMLAKLRLYILNWFQSSPLTGSGIVPMVAILASAALLCCFYTLADIYLSTEKQYLVGWVCVLLLLLCNKSDKFQKPPLRIIFILTASFISIRYMVWRTSETLVYDGVFNLIGMAPLYMAELYAMTLHLLGVFANIWPLETKIIPLPEDTSLYPSVDILIPTYNEDVDMVKITTIATLNMDYPRELLNVYILDDGATVSKRDSSESMSIAWERHYELRRVARELGVGYLTRQENGHAKAGNLNHALAHTRGDLVLVLDCDHVPTRDFLKNTVGWFLKDEKLAFVQTPHFFMNPDPIEKNIDILKDAPSENEMFYRACQPGLNLWNSSFFCGSAAIMRRKYLEEVGGICGETITEDCETALALHQRGYNSVFISRPMVCGLSPETFDDFILQRSRWAQGMTQMLMLNNPLFAKGLKFYQRICYLNNGIFWLFGISRFIFMLAPAAFLLLGLNVYFASLGQVVAFALPHVVASMILSDFLYGKYRWPFLSELYESIQSVYLMPVVISVFINPRKPSFKVTPKGKSLESGFISGLSVPFILMCAILIVSLPVGIIKVIQFPLYRDVVLITIGWTLFNLCLAMASFGAFYEKRQIRRNHRLWAKGKVLTYFPRLNIRIEAEMQDISLSGIGIALDMPVPPLPNEEILVEARDSSGEKTVVNSKIQRIMHKNGIYTCGLEFIAESAEERANVIRFVYGDSQRWVDYWSRNMVRANPFRMMQFVLKSSLKGFKVSMTATLQLIIRPLISICKNFKARILTKSLPEAAVRTEI